MGRGSNPRDISGNASGIMVTGGSGYIGRHLVRALSEQSETVVSMYRHRLPEPMKNVYPVCSDMGSAELIAAPLRGIDVVVHLAWEKSLVGPQDKISWDLKGSKLPRNILLLKNLVRGMEKAGTRRIIFLSAIGASRKAKHPFLQEKYLAEFHIINSKIPEKVILRSAVVSDIEDSSDKLLRSIINVMKFPGFYPVPASRTKLAPVHIKDLVRVFCRMTRSELIGYPAAIAELAGGEAFQMDQLFKLVSDRYVKGARLALTGFFGDSLLPLFERNQGKDPHSPKLKHFLAIGSEPDETTKIDNPLGKLLPEKYTSFLDSLRVGSRSA